MRSTSGCTVYVRDEQDLKTLGEMTYGNEVRWSYYVDAVINLEPDTSRYDHVLAFLLHAWLNAAGDARLVAPC